MTDIDIAVIPDYLAVYLKHIGAASAEERIMVEASDGSGLFSFKRMGHQTEVFAVPENVAEICGEAVDEF